VKCHIYAHNCAHNPLITTQGMLAATQTTWSELYFYQTSVAITQQLLLKHNVKDEALSSAKRHSRCKADN
jgi:hypothetical protein